MSDDESLVERAFGLEVSERDYPVREVEGRLPGFVSGQYYSNGPARYRVGNLRYRHLLDGDGMLRSLRFGGDGIRFANRFVRSRKFCDEERAGAPLYRTFGTRFPGDRLNRYGLGIESPVNVSTWRFAGRLLAFGEQGLPWELDPTTLETRGPFTFADTLNDVTPFSAHPKFDAPSGEMFNFGISFSMERPTLNVYRFGADGTKLYRRRLPIPDPASVHDCCLSPSYLLVYLNGHVLDVGAVHEAGRSIMEALHWSPERSGSLLVASRETGELLAKVALDHGYCLHTVNAFETEGRLVFDLIELDEPVYPDYQVIPDIFTRVLPCRPVRYVVDPGRWKVVEKIEVPAAEHNDFPAIDPRRAQRPNDHFWMMGLSRTGQPGRKYFDQLSHVDLAARRIAGVYRLPPRFYFGSEPTFVPNPEDPAGGLILCKRFDAERVRDAYLFFDAYDVAAGPVAVVHLEEATPPCFHGSYYPRGEAGGS